MNIINLFPPKFQTYNSKLDIEIMLNSTINEVNISCCLKKLVAQLGSAQKPSLLLFAGSANRSVTPKSIFKRANSLAIINVLCHEQWG